MSEHRLVAIEDNGHEEFADAEDFLENARDDVGLSEDLKYWFPEEYVELDLGHRGGGKSVRVARKLLLALKHNYTVYTNYELYPEKIGVDNKPRPLDLEFLLSFDTSLTNSVIGIGEVDTWVERKRAMSTSSILVEKFLHQLRKRGLRVFLDTQSPSLPTVILNQVDLMVQCHDSFYSDYGREHELYKGTNFFYEEEDYSGIFTGYPGKRWRTAIGNANRLWPLYNTYQIFDPWQWARKVEMVGDKMVFNMDEGKMYTSGEHNLEIEQKEIKQFNTLLIGEYRAWGDDLVALAIKNNAVLEERPNRWRFSIDRIQKAMTKVKGKQKRVLENGMTRFQQLAVSSKGYLARVDRGENVMELSRPLREADEDAGIHNVASFSKNELLSTATMGDTVRDLYATGYKTHQIANKLKISEQTVNATLAEEHNE